MGEGTQEETYNVYRVAEYIGGNNVWRIARKRKKIAIVGYKFGSYWSHGMITTPSPQLVQYSQI